MSEILRHYHFFVDAKRYETDQASITGAQIKEKAGAPAAYQLFLEEEGDTPDKPIADNEGIDLSESKCEDHEGEHREHKNIKHFYAVPPATFGI
jgi:hypothetical protein